MSLSEAQVNALLAPIQHGRIRQVQGNDHLEAWDVRRWLLRIFGWGGWDFIVKDCTLVSERSVWDEQNPLRGRHTVVYRVIGQLIIKDPQGNVVATFEDGATGDSSNQPQLGQAHDQALKTAMSQALKRCAVNLGDTYGLVLYSRGRPKDDESFAVVGRSLAHEGSNEHAVMEDVTAGEMDAPQAVEEEQPGTTSDASGQATSTTTAAATPPAAQAPAAPPPSPEVERQVANDLDHKAEKIRDQALALFAGRADRKRNEVIQDLGKLNIAASQQKALQVLVRRENGESVTLQVLLNELITSCTRNAPEPAPS